MYLKYFLLCDGLTVVLNPASVLLWDLQGTKSAFCCRKFTCCLLRGHCVPCQSHIVQSHMRQPRQYLFVYLHLVGHFTRLEFLHWSAIHTKGPLLSAYSLHVRVSYHDSNPPLTRVGYRRLRPMHRRSSRLAKSILSLANKPHKAKMESFSLPGTDVSVKLIEDVSKDEVLEFPAFKVGMSFLFHHSVW